MEIDEKVAANLAEGLLEDPVKGPGHARKMEAITEYGKNPAETRLKYPDLKETFDKIDRVTS